MDSFDDRKFRAALGHFATGVVIVAGCHRGRPAGFTVQSFVSLSLDPPLVALCPAKSSSSWPRIRDGGHFCINVLGEDQQALCSHFAQSAADKFAELDWRPGQTGSPILPGVLAYIDCDLANEWDAGDHSVAVGRVRDLEMLDAGRSPLLFFRGVYGRFQEF